MVYGNVIEDRNAIHEFYKLEGMLRLTKEEEDNFNRLMKRLKRVCIGDIDMGNEELTWVQKELVKLVAQGLTPKEIMIERHYSSECCVRSMLQEVYEYYENKYGIDFGRKDKYVKLQAYLKEHPPVAGKVLPMNDKTLTTRLKCKITECRDILGEILSLIEGVN